MDEKVEKALQRFREIQQLAAFGKGRICDSIYSKADQAIEELKGESK